MVVCGEEPLDEISAAGFSHVCEFDENKIERYKIHPSDFGYEACSLEELQEMMLKTTLKSPEIY